MKGALSQEQHCDKFNHQDEAWSGSMPVEEVLGPVMRVVVGIAVDIVIDRIVCGPGAAIARLFNRDKEPSTGLSMFIGTLFWLAVIVGGYFAFTYFAEGIAVDKCLDAGGKYDYRAEKCLHT